LFGGGAFFLVAFGRQCVSQHMRSYSPHKAQCSEQYACPSALVFRDDHLATAKCLSSPMNTYIFLMMTGPCLVLLQERESINNSLSNTQNSAGPAGPALNVVVSAAVPLPPRLRAGLMDGSSNLYCISPCTVLTLRLAPYPRCQRCQRGRCWLHECVVQASRPA
jgi:hypothetical protein